MDKLRALAAKKVAGIPVIWVVLVVAAILLYGALRMKGTPTEDEELSTDAAATDEEGDTTAVQQPVFTANPVIVQPSAGEAVELTNEVWGRRAIEWLIAPGQGFSLSVATAAIDGYLTGQTLSATEGQARDKAVRQFGLPPEGILTANTATASTGYRGPAARQGNPPTTHKVRNQNDDQVSELTRLYYGRTDADVTLFLKSANPSLVWPVKVGQTVTIPQFRRPKYFVATSAVHTLYQIARKNGQTPAEIQALNPGISFPVKRGTRVRVQ